MTTVTFEGYQQEFSSLMTQIQQALETSTHEKEESIDSLLSQCDDLLKQMSIEARGIDNEDEMKLQLLATVQRNKSQLTAVRQDYKHKLSWQQRESLFSGRERLLKNEEMAQQQLELLERAKETIADTEAVGAEIATELSRNRTTLERSQDNVNTFSSLTDKAASIIKTMSRRRGIKD